MIISRCMGSSMIVLVSKLKIRMRVIVWWVCVGEKCVI